MNGVSPDEDVRKVPSPPPKIAEEGATTAEVTIRTLASDLKSMGITGGTAAIGENFTVALKGDSSFPHEKKSPSRSWGMWVLTLVSALAFLFLVGYYFIPAILGSLR